MSASCWVVAQAALVQLTPFKAVVVRSPIADLNNDGNLDIITNGSSARVRLGDGTGSFDAPISFGNVPNTDSSSNDVVVGDFNNDQLPDIATTSFSSDSVSVLLNGGSATTTENAPVVINALANDSHPNHDPLSVNGLITSMTLGTVTQNGNTFTYDPGDAFQYLTAGQIANYNFYYTLTDGIATNNAEVYLTITGVNNAPVNSVPDRQLAQKNTPLVFSTTNGNRISIQDVDVGTNPLTVTLSASNGLLTLSNTSGLSFNTGDGTADPTITFTGTLSNINNALEGLNFSPDAGLYRCCQFDNYNQ